MKKTLLVLAVILLICLMPVKALADGPAPVVYNANFVYIYGLSDISTLEIWGHDKDNNYSFITQTAYSDNERTSGSLSEWFYNKDNKFKDFQLVITLVSGEKVYSNFVNIVPRGSYKYYAKDNTLSEGTSMEIPSQSSFSGLGLLFLTFALILPLLFTVLIEWIISLFFKLKPGKYVVIINFITNPILNILLFFIGAYNTMDYTLALIIFEAGIMGAEFWFYTWKYKGYSKKRLLLFSAVANAASWGLYCLFLILIGL